MMLKLDQKGFSMALVLVLSAVIAANTVYFMGLSKNTATSNALRSIEESELSEKRRLSSILSDNSVCASAAVLGNKVLTDLATEQTTPFTFSKGGLSFLTMGATYFSGSHTAASYQIDPATKILQIKYNISPAKQLSTLKKTALVSIPLVIKTDAAGKITDCYAAPTSTTGAIVAETITNACLGNSAYKYTGGAFDMCLHNIVPATVSGGDFMNTLSFTAPLKEQQYSSTAKYFGDSANSKCPSAQTQPLATSIDTTAKLTCSVPDVPCNNGTMMLMTASNAPICTFNETNSIANALFSSISLTGHDTYYTKPPNPCPNGTYAAEYDANGNVPAEKCLPLSITNKDCGALKFATDLNTSQTVDPLRCTAYSKVKACASPGTYVWITSLTTAVPTCSTALTY
ncbi:MAG: hypothetical protein PHY93_05965 [Bacteriovorax sp.]|nr:hypothetical protein [Bacteriovorax sp.]